MQELRVSLFEMSMCLSNAMDLVSPAVVDHHKRVAFIASSIAAEIGLSEKAQEDLIMAGLLHDIGAISLKDRLDALNFETDSPGSHAELGYRLIKTFAAFSDMAPLVRYHHLQWENGKGLNFRGEKVPLLCHVLHLADRIAVIINSKDDILQQSKNICRKITKNSGKKFVPEFVDAFCSLAQKESFWFDTMSSSISQVLTEKIRVSTIELNLKELLNLAGLFSEIIDFRSCFTATHSSGVAASSEALAKLLGLEEYECRLIKIAGYLHDLGKLAIPAEILEKPSRLTREENNIIKRHPYYTYRIIETVKGLDIINSWASFHHECLDGKGYPFRQKGKDIPFGARIIAVADIFTALTENRPYRQGMSRDTVLKNLMNMVKNSAIDPDIVSVLRRNYTEINSIRIAAQSEESAEYENFSRHVSC
ncbi:MAG: HD domain-containing protein [Nitrospirae bacterium]|nr:HD domain-containing protein [Nitrospirota bacterium]